MKHIIKQFIPPIIIRIASKLKNKDLEIEANAGDCLMWNGDYSSWEEAQKKSAGYSEQHIFNKCKNALLKVRDGQAVYERDSVLFDKKQYAWPVLACFENIALLNKNQLHLIDFGGSLGSSYYQNKHFLQGVTSLKWFVVEQNHFVECGKKDFENVHLKFSYSIEEVLSKEKVHCLFLSGVMQYLDNPDKWLQKFIDYNIDYLLFDRTSFIESEQRLTVQNVPEEIYKASYPCWFFKENDFVSKLQSQYELIAEFPGFADQDLISEDGKRMYWKGFFMKRKR